MWREDVEGFVTGWEIVTIRGKKGDKDKDS